MIPLPPRCRGSAAARPCKKATESADRTTTPCCAISWKEAPGARTSYVFTCLYRCIYIYTDVKVFLYLPIDMDKVIGVVWAQILPCISKAHNEPTHGMPICMASSERRKPTESMTDSQNLQHTRSPSSSSKARTTDLGRCQM